MAATTKAPAAICADGSLGFVPNPKPPPANGAGALADTLLAGAALPKAVAGAAAEGVAGTPKDPGMPNAVLVAAAPKPTALLGAPNPNPAAGCAAAAPKVPNPVPAIGAL